MTAEFVLGRSSQEQPADAYLPARLTQLLDIDGAAEGDDEQRQALGWQTVVADHSIQHLQGHLQEGQSIVLVPNSYPPTCPLSSLCGNHSAGKQE